MELCLCTARHKDPKNLGLHFYKSGQPSDDSAGHKAFFERYINNSNNINFVFIMYKTTAHFF